MVVIVYFSSCIPQISDIHHVPTLMRHPSCLSNKNYGLQLTSLRCFVSFISALSIFVHRLSRPWKWGAKLNNLKMDWIAFVSRIDHGQKGVTATTPEWFVVLGHLESCVGCPHQTTNHSGVVAVALSWLWSIQIITWLDNHVTNVFTTKYVQNLH